MAGLNHVVITGRNTKDPVVRTLDSGTKAAELSLVTSEKYKKKGSDEYTEDAEFHTIKLFGTQAEIAEKYIKKGDWTSVTGSIKTESWEKDGVKNYKTTIKCKDLVLIGATSKPNGTQHERGEVQFQGSSNSSKKEEEDDDGLPF